MLSVDTVGSPYIFLDDYHLSEDIKRGCRKSEFQFITKDIGCFIIDEGSGNDLPDFILDSRNNVPLISERLKKVFDSLEIKNLYYQRVKLERKTDNLSESYWLAVPPRIDCLDRDKSIIDTLWNKAEKVVIDPDKIGNYEIFKISGIVNNEIIVTDTIKAAVEKAGCTKGCIFFKDDNLL